MRRTLLSVTGAESNILKHDNERGALAEKITDEVIAQQQVDVEGSVSLHEQIRGLKSQGKTIVLPSPNLPVMHPPETVYNR